MSESTTMLLWLPLQSCNKCRKPGIGGSGSRSEVLTSCKPQLS